MVRQHRMCTMRFVSVDICTNVQDRLVVEVFHSELKGSGFKPNCTQPPYRHP